MAMSALTDRRAYVVDDEPGLRSIIRRTLVPAGILTEEFESAEAFLAIADDRPLGCILLDVRLPGMSGIELLAHLRSEDIRDPIIMISGHGDIPLALAAIKAGALDFIEKPFRNDTLLDVACAAFQIVGALVQSRSGKIGSLTDRELGVLKAYVDGPTDKLVARALDLSPRTVEANRASIVKKLGVQNFTQALFLAKDAGILS